MRLKAREGRSRYARPGPLASDQGPAATAAAPGRTSVAVITGPDRVPQKLLGVEVGYVQAIAARIRSRTCGGTGAPADKTRRSVGICSLRCSQYRPTAFHIAGDPKA